MPGWLTILAAILKAFGLAALVEGLIQRWQARQQGRADQRAADAVATNRQDGEARKVDESVAALSDAALDERLRNAAPGE